MRSSAVILADCLESKEACTQELFGRVTGSKPHGPRRKQIERANGHAAWPLSQFSTSPYSARRSGGRGGVLRHHRPPCATAKAEGIPSQSLLSLQLRQICV